MKNIFPLTTINVSSIFLGDDDQWWSADSWNDSWCRIRSRTRQFAGSPFVPGEEFNLGTLGTRKNPINIWSRNPYFLPGQNFRYLDFFVRNFDPRLTFRLVGQMCMNMDPIWMPSTWTWSLSSIVISRQRPFSTKCWPIISVPDLTHSRRQGTRTGLLFSQYSISVTLWD